MTNELLKPILLFWLLSLFSLSIYAQISICSWNLQNFGSSKNDVEIDFIANTVQAYDIILIQEVVAKDPGGAQAVVRLHNALNRKGAKWNYVISNPTVSSAYKAERYAFIWKSKITIIGKAWLEKKYGLEIDREPFLATFTFCNKQFTLANFHAITKSKQPETEIKYFKFLPSEYIDKNLVFCGDFNCPQSHTVFNPLKSMGFKPALIGQKTTLKEVCDSSNCLASEFDNIFFNTSKINYIKSGVIPFYNNFLSLKDARKISDHLPIYFQFSIN